MREMGLPSIPLRKSLILHPSKGKKGVKIAKIRFGIRISRKCAIIRLPIYLRFLKTLDLPNGSNAPWITKEIWTTFGIIPPSS